MYYRYQCCNKLYSRLVHLQVLLQVLVTVLYILDCPLLLVSGYLKVLEHLPGIASPQYLHQQNRYGYQWLFLNSSDIMSFIRLQCCLFYIIQSTMLIVGYENVMSFINTKSTRQGLRHYTVSPCQMLIINKYAKKSKKTPYLSVCKIMCYKLICQP